MLTGLGWNIGRRGLIKPVEVKMAVPRALASIKRFGPRYGRTNKYKFAASENLKKNLKCPYCCSKNVKREAIGIYFWKSL